MYMTFFFVVQSLIVFVNQTYYSYTIVLDVQFAAIAFKNLSAHVLTGAYTLVLYMLQYTVT